MMPSTVYFTFMKKILYFNDAIALKIVLMVIIVSALALFTSFEAHHTALMPQPSMTSGTSSQAESTTRTGEAEGSAFGAILAATSVLPQIASAAEETELMAWVYPGAPACAAGAEMADGRHITTLKAEYFTVRYDGTLELLTEASSGCNGYSAKNVALLKKYSERQFVTVSAASADAIDAFTANASQEAVKTLTTFAVQNNLTGVELDFEDFGGWSEEVYEAYKSFVTALGNELHAHGKQLMIDGPAIANTSEESWYVWRYQDFTNLPVDTMVIMAYDYQFDHGAGVPVAPLAWMESVIRHVSSQFGDMERLSVGLPSYGYRGTEGSMRVTLMTYDQIKKQANFKKAVRDVSSGEMTWKNGTTRFYFQDKESLRQKRAVAERLGISSVSVWHLGGNLWF
jgi:hypothetical protein